MSKEVQQKIISFDFKGVALKDGLGSKNVAPKDGLQLKVVVSNGRKTLLTEYVALKTVLGQDVEPNVQKDVDTALTNIILFCLIHRLSGGSRGISHIQ